MFIDITCSLESCFSKANRFDNLSVYLYSCAGKRIVVVTHGSVLKSLYSLATGGRIPDVKILRNTSYNVFHFSDNKWSEKNSGDFSHLKNSELIKYAY